MRIHKTTGAELMLEGWLPPGAAAERLGITERQLRARAERGDVRRRELIPGSRIFLYEIA